MPEAVQVPRPLAICQASIFSLGVSRPGARLLLLFVPDLYLKKMAQEGEKGTVSGCVQVVVGWILLFWSRGSRGLSHRCHTRVPVCDTATAHGDGVKKGVKRGSEAHCRPKL